MQEGLEGPAQVMQGTHPLTQRPPPASWGRGALMTSTHTSQWSTWSPMREGRKYSWQALTHPSDPHDPQERKSYKKSTNLKGYWGNMPSMSQPSAEGKGHRQHEPSMRGKEDGGGLRSRANTALGRLLKVNCLYMFVNSHTLVNIVIWCFTCHSRLTSGIVCLGIIWNVMW